RRRNKTLTARCRGVIGSAYPNDTLKPDSVDSVKNVDENRLFSGHPMRQITCTRPHHQLTNTNTWKPDSQGLVFPVWP
ncbi:hypothetical protein, partial [Salmonella enterica]|uniref:hypothetical protein n=1 Tax=Salmonella enterica TaxID=28901 RepID=UPI001F57A4CC